MPCVLLPEVAQKKLAEYTRSKGYDLQKDRDAVFQDPKFRLLCRQAYPDTKLPVRALSENIGKWDDIWPEISERQNLKAVNPHYGEDKKWRCNCQRCVVAYEMRRRGYDVTACPCEHFDASDPLVMDPSLAWENPVIYRELFGSGRGAVENALKKWGNGARVQICIYWKYGDGHTFTAEMIDGQIRYIDSQNDKWDFNAEEYFSQASRGWTTFWRIDTLQPSARALACCKGVKK